MVYWWPLPWECKFPLDVSSSLVQDWTFHRDKHTTGFVIARTNTKKYNPALDLHLNIEFVSLSSVFLVTYLHICPVKVSRHPQNVPVWCHSDFPFCHQNSISKSFRNSSHGEHIPGTTYETNNLIWLTTHWNSTARLTLVCSTCVSIVLVNTPMVGYFHCVCLNGPGQYKINVIVSWKCPYLPPPPPHPTLFPLFISRLPNTSSVSLISQELPKLHSRAMTAFYF